MEHKNYERELKYLLNEGETVRFKDILQIFHRNGYMQVEMRMKKKHESYFDDSELSFTRNGDVIRSSKHFNINGTYFHFMYKKNVSREDKPYVSKYELGSGEYTTVLEFLAAMDIQADVLPEPFLYAEMTRETAVIEKNQNRLLISYDDVRYYTADEKNYVFEKMLEVEDWTHPNTLKNADSKYDAHLCEANEILLLGSDFSLVLTKDSKPYRGLLLLKMV